MAAFIGLCLLFQVFGARSNAQVRPIYDRGATGLGQMLKRLNTTASALMIGAHPDDEDTALLTYLARGESARTAYLSLTRGDGGQNIIGPELGEALGVIRTEELLQARRLDGSDQYFTRAYDYGFSKTLDEAKSKWDEKVILCDVVRVIRNFRPLVVISQFTGTSADGHGQHQFAGYISPLAVKAAADASQCTDAGPAWTVKKFYVRHGFRATGEPQLKINTGKYDPLLGRSYFEIAMEARSQHKSQEQGVLELKGDQFSGLNLAESKISKVENETGIFDGIDSTALAFLKHEGRFAADQACISEAIASALASYIPDTPHTVLPKLIRAYGCVENIDNNALMETVRANLTRAIELATGMQVDALANRETVTQDEEFSVRLNIFSPLRESVVVRGARLKTPPRWTQYGWTDSASGEQPANARREVAVYSRVARIHTPKGDMEIQPYWLLRPRIGDLYYWKRGDETENWYQQGREFYSQTQPFGPPLLEVEVETEILGKQIIFKREVEFRFADDIRGEVRRSVDGAPKITVEMDQSLMIVPGSDKAQTRQVVMTVTNHSQKPVTGTASLNFNTPVEWKYVASSKTFELKRTGEKTTITFDVTIPARTKAGSYQISGQAMVGEALANMTMKTIAYPHIQTHRYYRPATVDVKIIDLKTARSKIGYIVGSGDRVPDAIRQMGFDMEIVSERDLASGDLSRFDSIVVGIRAYQVRPDVVANNERLLNYARNGGTLIVQYQLPSFAQQNLMPYPAQMGPRVVDENAKVTILQPEHPIFNIPNKITDADFAGWVQERNLYNFSTMDAAYMPLLESHDAGEAENKGGLVIAKVGKGNWVYCSYSFFRQLPAGVPGAYRLLANMLSLPNGK